MQKKPPTKHVSVWVGDRNDYTSTRLEHLSVANTGHAGTNYGVATSCVITYVDGLGTAKPEASS